MSSNNNISIKICIFQNNIAWLVRLFIFFLTMNPLKQNGAVIHLSWKNQNLMIADSYFAGNRASKVNINSNYGNIFNKKLNILQGLGGVIYSSDKNDNIVIFSSRFINNFAFNVKLKYIWKSI
jgi:hypothetical protein